MSSQRVESADFAEKMAETVSVMKGLALTIADAPGRNGHLAHAASVGMSDLAAQGVLQRRCPQWEGPVGDSYSIGAMTLIAASDYGHGYASLFEVSERAPAFAHLALTRAGLEACVVSIWLNDPRIDTERRVKRGLCEQLHSTWEVGRLKIDDEQQQRIAGAKAFWQDCADAFGWEVSNNRGKPVVGGEQRPSMPVRISELVVGHGDKPIGKALWSFLSAVIHVGWYGITPAVIEAAIRAWHRTVAGYGWHGLEGRQPSVLRIPPGAPSSRRSPPDPHGMDERSGVAGGGGQVRGPRRGAAESDRGVGPAVIAAVLLGCAIVTTLFWVGTLLVQAPGFLTSSDQGILGGSYLPVFPVAIVVVMGTFCW